MAKKEVNPVAPDGVDKVGTPGERGTSALKDPYKDQERLVPFTDAEKASFVRDPEDPVLEPATKESDK